MPECANCGAFVTERFVRVLTPEHRDNPRCCPSCPDMVRDAHGPRPAKTPRSSGRAVDYQGEGMDDD